MYSSNWTRAVTLFGMVTLAMIIGCGEGNPFGTVKVTGVVTLDGQPVDGAMVIFQPESSGGKAATALTKANGEFALTTGSAEDGAVPGKYKVTVVKTEKVDVPDLEGLSPEEAATKAKQHEDAMLKKYPQGPPPPADLLPVKYKTAEKSGLEFEVKDGDANHFEIKLSKGG